MLTLNTMKTSFFWLAMAGLLASLLTGCSPAQSASQTGSSAGAEITWLTDYDATLKLAQFTNKLVVVDFYATWCGYCKLMDRNTFTDANVQQRLAGFVPLKIDADKQPQLAAKYGVEGLPMMLVIDANGKPLAGAAGYLEPDRYLAVLDQAKTSSTGTNDVVK